MIDRAESHWADSIHNFERASELDPKHGPHLVNLGTTYYWVKDYDQMAKVMDRIVAMVPDHKRPRIIRANIELEGRGDTRPLRAAIEKILTNEPGSDKDPVVADARLDLALYDRDWTPLAALRQPFLRRAGVTFRSA